jgi:hypothetical protein
MRRNNQVELAVGIRRGLDRSGVHLQSLRGGTFGGRNRRLDPFHAPAAAAKLGQEGSRRTPDLQRATWFETGR